MDKKRGYMLSLLAAILLLVILLSSFNGLSIEIYVCLFTIIYFSISAIYQPRLRSHDFVGIGLFVAFMGIIVYNLVKIFSQL